MSNIITTKKNILLICGCARSGTTALTRLLNNHPQINISIEKYQLHFKREDASFSKVNFELDKNVSPIYIGDKVPSFYKNYSKIFNSFPDAKVLFIFRNIFDVAQSYKNRKEDEKDQQWKKGVRRAVEEWNESIVNTLSFIEKKNAIIPIAYERIFFQKTNFLTDKLKIKSDPDFSSFYDTTIRHARKIEKNRAANLSPQDKLWIMNNAKFGAYKKLFQL